MEHVFSNSSHDAPAPKPKRAKKPEGLLSALHHPAKRLAEATALFTALSLGADTVRPNPDKRSVDQVAEQLQDFREIESRKRKDGEEDSADSEGVNDI